MMAKLISIVTIIAIASVCVFADEERYSDQYDHINPTDILSNDKLRDQYLKCYMGTGPCVTPDAKFFKELFSEAFVTKCKKCTDKQKESLDIIVDWYTKNQPEQWETVVKKALKEAKEKNISA